MTQFWQARYGLSKSWLVVRKWQQWCLIVWTALYIYMMQKIFSILSNWQTDLFRIDLLKNGLTLRVYGLHPWHQTPQGLPVTRRETPLQNIKVGNINRIQRSFMATSSIRYSWRIFILVRAKKCDIQKQKTIEYWSLIHWDDRISSLVTYLSSRLVILPYNITTLDIIIMTTWQWYSQT